MSASNGRSSKSVDGIAQEVPARVQEGVRHVGLPARLTPAARALGAVPLLHAGQRRHARVVGLEVLDPREHHRQVLFRDRHGSALVAVDDGDGGPPVALAGDAPIVQTVVHAQLAQPALCQPLRDGGDGVVLGQPVEARGVHQDAVVGPRLLQGRVGPIAGPRDHPANDQSELARELEVPAVVTGHRHDGSRSVLHEHVVGDPHGDGLARGRIPAVATGEHARLRLVRLLPGHQVHLLGLGTVRLDLVATV